MKTHTGTLYSFRTANEDFWYHTADITLLNSIQQSGFFGLGEKVSINDKQYKITEMSAQVMAGPGEPKLINEYQHGEPNPFSVQVFITIEPA